MRSGMLVRWRTERTLSGHSQGDLHKMCWQILSQLYFQFCLKKKLLYLGKWMHQLEHFSCFPKTNWYCKIFVDRVEGKKVKWAKKAHLNINVYRYTLYCNWYCARFLNKDSRQASSSEARITASCTNARVPIHDVSARLSISLGSRIMVSNKLQRIICQ